MYKVMLADDEGIVTDSLRYILEESFAGQCEIRSAKTGRAVIELAETFRPDIAFMDIQMPGINGIEAMREIRTGNENTIFIVLTAYDKFDYARQSIGLGVLDYLNKPFSRDAIEEVMRRAMAQVDAARTRRKNELQIREKIETVTPIIESGFIYSVLFQGNEAEAEKYRTLLGIEEEYGFMVVITADEPGEGAGNPVGTGIRIQTEAAKLRDVIRGHFNCIVGPLLSNKVICFFPAANASADYNARVSLIERSETLIRELGERFDAAFRIGIGSVEPLPQIATSYKQALEALDFTGAEIAHVKDLPVGCAYEPDYPIDLEKRLFAAVQHGDVGETAQIAGKFFDWMEQTHPEALVDAQLKCLEFVLWAEHLAYESGGMTYRFLRRTDYLPTVTGMRDFPSLRIWFTDKTVQAARDIATRKEEREDSVIESARSYMRENFDRDLSLDEVSSRADVSPYYFSRLFKEETGETFMEYLTALRVNRAKELLADPAMSVKDICTAVGYADPNYFSRIFKKAEGVTPTEYRTALEAGGGV
ncbi:MAG: helix-turn-helix domain-containing protein [Lachnospiraceae bacterium]|nr:helix-turn-helix domain-containing protein [Lachnospiraceae bacterium]